MGRPYSNDRRERVVGAVEQGGMSRHQAAAHFGVAISTAINWVKRFRQTASVAPGQMGGHKPRALSGEHREWLIARCRDRAFTLRELVAELAAERGLRVDYRSVWAFVHAEGLSYKKSVLASEHDRPDIGRRRLQWRHYQTRIDPARLVFIDEIWTKTNMAPLRGWGPVGDRLLGKVPYGHWNTITLIAALRHDRIDAPWLLDGPVNGESFRIYVERLLAPTLGRGDVVIMDNLGSHKGLAIRQAIRNAGTKLILLPKYSPDVNPIEQVFAKLNACSAKAAARTRNEVCTTIGALLRTYTAAECASYFRNSGYGQT